MNKMTMKNTVAEIKEFLSNSSVLKSVKADKDLFARMLYTSKALKSGEKVAKKDLLDLATDVFTVVAAAEEAKNTKKKGGLAPDEKKPEAKPEKESSLKKKPSKGKATDEPKKSEKAEEPKKGADKSKSKKTEDTKPKNSPKKEEKKQQPPKEEKPKKFSFPEEFEDEDGIKYTLDEDLNSYEAIKEAIDNEEEIVIATHWTEAMLKTGLYGNGQITKKSDMPKAFVEELDLLQVIYVAENLPNVITVSMYTECEYWFAGSDFKKMISNNLAFAVYRTEEA